jgi:hypothetical protein
MSIESHDHCVVCEHCGAHESPELHESRRCPDCESELCRNCEDGDCWLGRAT